MRPVDVSRVHQVLQERVSRHWQIPHVPGGRLWRNAVGSVTVGTAPAPAPPSAPHRHILTRNGSYSRLLAAHKRGAPAALPGERRACQAGLPGGAVTPSPPLAVTQKTSSPTYQSPSRAPGVLPSAAARSSAGSGSGRCLLAASAASMPSIHTHSMPCGGASSGQSLTSLAFSARAD